LLKSNVGNLRRSSSGSPEKHLSSPAFGLLHTLVNLLTKSSFAHDVAIHCRMISIAAKVWAGLAVVQLRSVEKPLITPWPYCWRLQCEHVLKSDWLAHCIFLASTQSTLSTQEVSASTQGISEGREYFNPTLTITKRAARAKGQNITW
jgi:hypothetical protein